MVIASPSVSVISLNVSGLNCHIKRHKVIKWIKKQDLTICCLHEIHFRYKDTHGLNVKQWIKIFHANANQKRTGVTISISNKIGFKPKTVIGGKEGHCIMIKWLIYQKEIKFVNIYAPNNRTPNI